MANYVEEYNINTNNSFIGMQELYTGAKILSSPSTVWQIYFLGLAIQRET